MASVNDQSTPPVPKDLSNFKPLGWYGFFGDTSVVGDMKGNPWTRTVTSEEMAAFDQDDDMGGDL